MDYLFSCMLNISVQNYLWSGTAFQSLSPVATVPEDEGCTCILPDHAGGFVQSKKIKKGNGV